MKMFIRTLMFGALTTLMGTTAAHAQVTEAMQFKTTFPFTVGNTKYPAGSFTIKPADDGDNMVLELTNGKITTVVLVEPEERNPNQVVKDEVVFNKYGDEYVLNEIWDSADGTGARAERSLAETRHAKKHGAPTKESVSSSRGLASGS